MSSRPLLAPWPSPNALSDTLIGARCASGRVCTVVTLAMSPPVARRRAEAVSSTRLRCDASTCVPAARVMPLAASTVTLAKPWSVKRPLPSRVVAAGTVPVVPSGTMRASPTLSVSSPPLVSPKPRSSACIQSGLTWPSAPLARVSLPPSPAVTRWLAESAAPPLTSSTEPPSRRVWYSGLLSCSVRLPPLSADCALPRPVGTTGAARLSAVELFTHSPAVESVAPLRTVMPPLAPRPAAGEAASAACSVSAPPARRRWPAMSICCARSVSSAPGSARRLTPSATTMRPLEFNSTVPKPVSTRPCSVCVAAPNTWSAPRLKPLRCVSVSAVPLLKAAPSESPARCVMVMLPICDCSLMSRCELL